MADNSKIEWTHHTANFWWGCTKVSPACAHCHAETLAKIFSHGLASWGANGLRWIRAAAACHEVKRMNKRAQKAGVVARVFVNSMSDTFEAREDLDAPRQMLWEAIESSPWLIFLLLTKRPENVLRMVPSAWRCGLPSNVWIGTTVENQDTADTRIPQLLSIPARTRFLSCEPLLEAVDLTQLRGETCEECGDVVTYDVFNATARCRCCSEGDEPVAWNFLHWVICGGESGAHARPMHPEWARSLRDQCAEAGVSFFFKQWGEWLPCEEHYQGPEWKFQNGEIIDGHWLPDFNENPVGWECDHESAAIWKRVGKLAAGRLMDGVEHSAFPSVPGLLAS